MKVLFYVGERGDERGPSLAVTSRGLKLKVVRSRKELVSALSAGSYDLVVTACEDQPSVERLQSELEKLKTVPLLTLSPQGAASFRDLARSILAEKNPEAGEAAGSEPPCPEGREAAGQGPDRKLELSRRFMDDNFTRPLSLSEIAGLAGISPSYFCRKFKEVYGVSPVNYLKRLRLARAAHLLERTGLPLSEVTRQSGFFSIPYFCREFKKENGATPLEHRRGSSSKPRSRRRSTPRGRSQEIEGGG